MERIGKGTLLVREGGRENEKYFTCTFFFAAILNIHMHKKDSKKALMLQKWIAFCYEMHVSSIYNSHIHMHNDMLTHTQTPSNTISVVFIPTRRC